jgi:hypothetical protein
MKRWLNFKSRHGGPFAKKPSPRRGWALRNWGIDPSKLVAPEQAPATTEMLDEYQRKAMQKHIADKQAVDNTAVIIRGNPKFIADNPAAEDFYANLQKHMEQQGYAVTQDAGEPHTTPPAANVWLGHSRGVDRFRFAPEGTRTIGLGAPDGINHPDDTAMKPGDVPTAAHYKLTPEMLAALSAKLQKQSEQKTFYHGSPTPNLTSLQVRQPSRPTHVPGVYSTDNLDWAALYALAKNHRGMAVVGGATPKLLIPKDTELLPESTVYEYASDKYTPPPESDPNIGWAVRHDVTPTKAHIVKLVDHMKNIERFDDKESLRKRFAELTGKTASSKLRSLFKLVPDSARSGMYRAFVGKTPAGLMKTTVDPFGRTQIVRSELSDKFRGMGLGKKMYMELARQVPGGRISSDTEVSDAAQRVWRSLMRQGRGVSYGSGVHMNTLGVLGFRFKDLVARLDAAAKGLGANPSLFKMTLPQKIPLIKQSALLPEVQLQEHQKRIQDAVDDDNPRMIVYHGLGSGKSLSALAAAEAAKQKYNDDYGIVAPASLRGNFQKEVEKFTTGSKPEIMSYTGLGLGKKFTNQPQTVIMDEAHRLRNPGGSAAQAAKGVAENAKRLLLLTGSPITNSPSDLANLISLVARKNISPQEFERRYVGYKTVHPGIINFLAGVKPGVRPVVKNENELRQTLTGHVDYQPSKTPEGVNVNEEKITVPLSGTQQRIQKALRTKIPPGFLWKLDKEFPLSRDELSKLNSFLTGLRQNSVSPLPFRADKDTFKAFQQSGKLQEAYKRLRETLDSDPRRKAIIYSNHIGAGLEPYAAALNRYNIPHGMFHGGVPTKIRQQALKDYNEGKLRALLIGPAGAEGLSTKGTNLIQLLDPHWHESRTQQAQGRGLRFDSHDDLPEELKNVAVQRFISKSEEPSFIGKLMGYRRERTGDEILERLSKEKEVLNERFRQLLREVGTQKKTAAQGMGAAPAPTPAAPKPPAAPTTPSPGFVQSGKFTYLAGKAPPPQAPKSLKPGPMPASLMSGKAELKPAPVTVQAGMKTPEDTIRAGVRNMTGYDVPALSFSGPGRDPSQVGTLVGMGMDMWNNGFMRKTNADLTAFGEKQAVVPLLAAAAPYVLPAASAVGLGALSYAGFEGARAAKEHIAPSPPPPTPIINYNIAPENMNPWAAGAIGAAAVGTPIAAYYAYRRWADRKKQPEEKTPAYAFGKKQASSTLESLLSNKLLLGSLKGGLMGGAAGAISAEKGKILRGALRGATFGVPVGLLSAAGGKTFKDFSDTELAYGGKPVGALPGYQQVMHGAAEPTGAVLGALAGMPLGAHLLAKTDKEFEKADQRENDTKKKDEKEAGFRWYKRFPMTENLAVNLSLGGPSLTVKKLIPGTSFTLGKRAPRMYIGTPIPGLAYQQYLSPKKHKVKAEKEFKDDPDDQRTLFEKIKDTLFGSDYGPNAD